jgi:uncharacterized protein (TIGR03083 family)
MATPLAAAQPMASPQVVVGEAGFAGGSLRLIFFHPPVTAFAVSRAATSVDAVAVTFQATLLSTAVLSVLSLATGACPSARAPTLRRMFPGEKDYLAERRAVLATMESLTLENGRTLCAEWAPRDVLAHLIGIDEAVGEYVKAVGNINKANGRIVERMKGLSREELLARARDWAEKPALLPRTASWALLGDLAVHHQDVLRGLGRTRTVPEESAKAILREGLLFGARKLGSFRIVPSDHGRPMGRGQVVRGTAEQLGLWLAGRHSVATELVFGPAQ